jgi:hypothetical protein
VYLAATYARDEEMWDSLTPVRREGKISIRSNSHYGGVPVDAVNEAI